MTLRVTCLFALLLSACASDTPGSNPASRVLLSATPMLDLALDTDDATLIGRLTHATRLPDGRLAVLDADANVMVLLDSAGTVLRRVGREGAGPGEFEFPSWVGRCNGDSLFVWDPSLARISVFDAAGDFSRLFKPPVASPMRFACNDRGVFAALDIAAVPFGPPRAGEEPPDLRGPLLIFNASADTLGAQPSLPVGQSRVLGPLASVAIDGDRVIVGISNSRTLRRFDSAGIELARDSIDLPLRPLPDSLYQRELDRMSGFAGAEEPMRSRIREMLAASPKPDNMPLYQAMFLSPDRTLWFATSTLVETSTMLMGRDAEGRLLALELPAGIEVFDVGNDYVLGKVRADDGSERLVVYQFSR